MNDKFEPIIEKMKAFLDESDKQTADFASEIIHDPLYRELVRSLSPKEYVRYPLLTKFLKRNNELNRPVLMGRLRRLAEKLKEGR